MGHCADAVFIIARALLFSLLQKGVHHREVFFQVVAQDHRLLGIPVQLVVAFLCHAVFQLQHAQGYIPLYDGADEFHKGYEEAGENKEIAQEHQRIIEQPGTERRRHVLVEFPVEICPADQGNKVNAAESGRGNDQEFYKQAEKRSAAASFHNGKTDSR